jgi:hypothetical protein
MDMLEELYDELAARGITFAMARVKQDLYAQFIRKRIALSNPRSIHPCPRRRSVCGID